MTAPDVPDDVREFLRGCVESYEELEIALRLRRHEGVARSSESMAAELLISNEAANAALARLLDAGVVAGDDGRPRTYRFAPRTEAIRATVDRLAAAYEERRLVIMGLMAANAIDRIRSSAARAFADSFVWGRRRDDA